MSYFVLSDSTMLGTSLAQRVYNQVREDLVSQFTGEDVLRNQCSEGPAEPGAHCLSLPPVPGPLCSTPLHVGIRGLSVYPQLLVKDRLQRRWEC